MWVGSLELAGWLIREGPGLRCLLPLHAASHLAPTPPSPLPLLRRPPQEVTRQFLWRLLLGTSDGFIATQASQLLASVNATQSRDLFYKHEEVGRRREGAQRAQRAQRARRAARAARAGPGEARRRGEV